MKISSIILLVTFLLLVTAMFASNILLKKEYDKVDKSDLYWTYSKILQQPFKHLKIVGGNVTNIAFEQSANSSVRLFKNWDGYDKGTVKAFVRNDTLFLTFLNTFQNQNEKNWLKYITPVRIFSPELLSVHGTDTNLELFKMKQKSITVNVSGKSKVEVESYLSNLDSLSISQRDSSQVVFEMSPDVMTVEEPKAAEKTATSRDIRNLNQGDVMLAPAAIRKGWETINVRYVNADVKDVSLLDIGHAQIQSLEVKITDSAAVILSGGTLKRIRK